MGVVDDLVAKFMIKCNVTWRPEQVVRQIGIAEELLRQYGADVVSYCISHIERYTKNPVYSMNFLPYIISDAQKDFEKDKALPKMISAAQQKRVRDVAKISKQVEPIHVDFKKKKRALKDIDISDIGSVYGDLF